MKLTLSKSLMSVATAALLVTGFTGCNNSESTTGSSYTKTQAKGTVTGTVMDTNGNPLSGVTVSLAGETTTTDAGGIYVFKDVPVTNVAGADASTANGWLLVTISAPSGYLGATVTVKPEAQIDDAEGHLTEGQAVNGYETFIDGFLAQAGTAVLPKLDSSASGAVRLATGEAVGGVEVRLDFTTNSTSSTASEQQDSVSTTYAVSTYTVTTAADGSFAFPEIPSDSTFRIYVPGYTVYSTDQASSNSFTTNNEGLQALGNVHVSPITSSDTVAPTVASVSHAFGLYNGGLMLDQTVGNQITINFSESMMAVSNVADYVKVYGGTDGNTALTVTDVTISGKQMTITLSAPIVEGDKIDVFVQREAYLSDLAGNLLAFTGITANDEYASMEDNVDLIDLGADCAQGCEDGSLDYLSCTAGGRVIYFDLYAYRQLNTMAEAATDGVQMELNTDVNRTASSELSQLETYSNAFNDVYGMADDAIFQLNNVSENRDTTPNNVANRLSALAQALTGNTPDPYNTDTARISFVASNAPAYQITVPDPDATCTATNLTIHVAAGSCASVDGGGTTYTVSGFAEGETVELVIGGVQHGDTVVITPIDDLCKPGTALDVALVDNVAPTTVLQNSYCVGNSVHGGLGSVVAFGNGGELTNPYDASGTLGIPALFVTPGLLDNLDVNGVDILAENNPNVYGDNNLTQELYVHNWADNNYTNRAVYDATDYEEFITALGRTVGVSFSEDVDLTGVTPTYTGTTVSNYQVKNNVTHNDTGAVIDEQDLVHFDTTDVLSLANDNDGEIMSFEGILDLAGNAADASAKVVTIDAMPPFVTRALFDGENVTITFDEAIQLVDGVTVLTINGKDATYSEAAATWVLNADATVLTLPGAEFAGGLTQSDFSLDHEYDESALYGLDAGDYRHAELVFSNVQDVHGNSWDSWRSSIAETDCSAEVNGPDSFAIISNIGEFEVTTNTNGFIETDDNATQQTIVWTFNQTIKTGTGEFFTACDTTQNGATTINEWFEYVDVVEPADYNLSDFVGSPTFTLAADCKRITFTFTGTNSTAGLVIDANDIVRTKTGKVFTSAVDETQNNGLTATANDDPALP